MKRLGWIGLALIFAAASAAAAWTLYRFPPVEWPFYPRCMFHQISGCLCPGCGSLRAIHLLLHGQLQAAFQANALLLSSLAAMPLIASWLAWRAHPVFGRSLMHPADGLGSCERGSPSRAHGSSLQSRTIFRSDSWLASKFRRHPNAALWWLTAIVMGFGVLRNLPVAPFRWLAP
ncbi:MAG: DUF2752 domain-containing protein [Verrucomicrobia bacterium]|nr:DUF2752 domain-containing protein [Verrucomicrobiota bacterium]